MSPRPKHTPPRAIGYVRCSTEEQVVSGLGIEAQRAAIEAKAQAEGWTLLGIDTTDVGVSGKSIENRPGIQAVLELLDSGKADVLIVHKLDRLTRSLADGAGIMQRAMAKRWSLISCDTGDLDMSTPTGEALAGNMFVFAQLERRLIGQRTAAALAVKRANGVRLGRPQALPDAVVQRILDEREAGRTMASIASGLTDDGVPTARGGDRWQVSSVQAVLRSQRAAKLRNSVA